MKITIEVPDETVLVVCVARAPKKTERIVLDSKELKKTAGKVEKRPYTKKAEETR